MGQASEEVVTALLACLNDDNSNVRWSAAEALGRLGQVTKEVVPRIVHWIEQHSGHPNFGYGVDALWYALVESS